MRCDFTDCGVLADVLSTNLANGDTGAWCFAHYIDLCRAVVAGADAAGQEADEAAADAERRLSGTIASGTSVGVVDSDDDVHAEAPEAATFPVRPRRRSARHVSPWAGVASLPPEGRALTEDELIAAHGGLLGEGE